MRQTNTMLTFFDAPVSGNTWKVRLLLKQLSIPHEAVRLDILGGAVRTPEYRAKNPFGRVPFIDDGGFQLAESNAILLYLARGSRLLPDDPRKQALIHQWMFFEQNQLETPLGTPRYLREVVGKPDQELEKFYAPKARSALKILERHLASRQWVVDEYSVADICLFAYTQFADVKDFSAIAAWQERVRAQPGYFKLE
jgi:glutathione S-transferase